MLAASVLDDAYRAIAETPFSVNAGGVLANDIASSRNPLVVTGNTAPSHGSLVLNSDGTFLYTPTPNYVGPDRFTYTAADAQGHSGTASVNLTIVPATTEAAVSAGTRLASVDSTQGALLNAVLGSLTGSTLNLTALDYNGLANSQVNGGDLVNSLQMQLGLATPSQALATNITLAQLFAASANAAQAEGNTALANVFNSLGVQVGGLAGTIQLGNLLNIDPNDGSLANTNLNTLDLVTGSAELFNFANVATTPTPVTVSGDALGLGGVVNSATLQAQVVEPPVFIRGPVGTQFHTAQIRLKTDLDLTDLAVPLAGLLPGVTASATLGNLSLYTEVASGDGTIAAIDAIGRSVTIQATPGVADVYLGSIPDAVFFNRANAITPADVAFGDIGSLAVNVEGVPAATLGLQAKSTGLGQAPTTDTLVFNAPFPQTQTDSTSATFLANLTNSLVSNLAVQTNGSFGALPQAAVNSIQAVLQPTVATALTPALTTALANVADPALQTLGVGLGQEIITVEALGRPPEANDDFALTAEGNPVAIPVLGNDAAAPGDPVTVFAVTQPAHGTATINPDGTVTYTPTAGFVGRDMFGYATTDGLNGTSYAVVSVDVVAPPVASPDTYTATVGTPLTIGAPGVLGNDTDSSGQPLTATDLTQPAHGTVVLNSDGSFTYTPTAGYQGPDSFTYQAADSLGTSNPATVSINVAAAQVVVANPDAYTATLNTPLTIPPTGVLGNDNGPPGQVLTTTGLTQPTHGTVVLNPDGSFTYTPANGYLGSDSFTYRATATAGVSNPATVFLTVAATPPVANDNTYTVGGGTTLNPPAPGVLANDSGPGTGTLTAVLATPPSHGTLTLNADGSFTYVPVVGYIGPDAFAYRALQGGIFSNPATVSLNVLPASGDVNPRVVSITRLGFHSQPTSLVLTFNTALDPARAQDPANYSLVALTGNRVGPTRAGTAYAFASATYDPVAHTVTLVPVNRGLVLRVVYQLTINGSAATGLTSASGLPLDGQGNGTASGNFVTNITPANLAGPSPGTVLSPAQIRRAQVVANQARVAEARAAAVQARLAAQQARAHVTHFAVAHPRPIRINRLHR